MIRPINSIMLGMICVAAANGGAQAAPGQPAAPGPVLSQVFLAPSGEPFRAPRGAPYPVANWFAGADRNGDGKLSASEFSSDFGRFFDLLDRDRDQRLTDQEIRRYEADVAPEVRSGVYGGPDPRLRPDDTGSLGAQATGMNGGETPEQKDSRKMHYTVPAGGASYGILAIPEPVTGMDGNLNGVITREEALFAAQRRFRLLDQDKHGYLTLSGLPRTQVQGLGGRLKRN